MEEEYGFTLFSFQAPWHFQLPLSCGKVSVDGPKQLSLAAAAGEGSCYKRRVGEAGVGDGTGSVTADGIGDDRPE